MIFQRRIQRLAAVLASYLKEDASVLDVGCGDGQLDELICKLKPGVSLQGIDVMARHDSRINVLLFDGCTIPYQDSVFDFVMLVDVLHHCDDPALVLAEASRVARAGVLIKDHLLEGVLAKHRLRLMDWVGNASHGVRLPYNYFTRAEWEDVFSRLNLKLSVWRESLSLYPPPASWIFERQLHFVALLKPCSS